MSLEKDGNFYNSLIDFCSETNLVKRSAANKLKWPVMKMNQENEYTFEGVGDILTEKINSFADVDFNVNGKCERFTMDTVANICSPVFGLPEVAIKELNLLEEHERNLAIKYL